MTRTDLNKHIINYLEKYHPDRIGIFGSYVRNENTKDSDLDILVRFKQIPSLLQLVRIKRELSEILGISVDIVTESALKNDKIRKNIEKDLQIIL